MPLLEFGQEKRPYNVYSKLQIMKIFVMKYCQTPTVTAFAVFQFLANAKPRVKGTIYTVK